MKKSIWQVDDENKSMPITKEKVEIVEKKLKVKLPESYISLLKEQNGGYIIFDSFPTNFPTSWADDHIHIDHIRGIEEGGTQENDYLIKEWGLPKEVFLISGDGHTWIAFDYRNKNEEPPIIFIDNDGTEIIELAPNFETFLNGLTIWEESDTIETSEDDEIQEKYFKGEISDEEMKKIISEQTRDGRTNEQIKAEIDETIADEVPKKVVKKFGEVLSLGDAEVEKYMINKIKHHESPKVRSDLGSYLLACAMGDNDVLDMGFVKNSLLDMREEKHKSVRFYIEAGLECLGISNK